MKKTSDTLSLPKVEQGIPIPHKRGGYPLMDAMRQLKKPGLSLVLSAAMRYRVHPTATRLGIKVTVRKISDIEIRVWRVE